MAADPNWLYSSTVQATGALVAILGGFLASTLLIRIGERNSLLARSHEKRVELNTLHKRHTDLYVKNYGHPPSGQPLTDTHPFLAAVEKDIAVATGVLDSLDAQLRATADVPQHAKDAWKFLAIAAVLGIAPGLLLMPQDPADFQQWQKLLVIASFAIALVVLGVFIARLFDEISNTERK